MAWHGVIPEHVPVVTSVGAGRPGMAETPLGGFQFCHLAEALRFGYAKTEVALRQSAFVASPEKALLDLVHLTPGADDEDFLRELRLQNPAAFQLPALDELAKLHAVLNRKWTRGRDLYDLTWYLADRRWPAPNLSLLNAALTQTGWTGPVLVVENWRSELLQRLATVDWERARTDVRPFLERERDLDLVSHDTVKKLLESA